MQRFHWINIQTRGGIKSFIHQIAYLNHTTEYAEKADFFLHKKLTGDENNIFDPAAKL